MTTNEEIWTKFERHLQNEAVTQKRINKVRSMFNAVVLRGLKNKDLNTITREDLEEFVHKLNTGKFKKLSGEDWSGRTKLDIKKFLRQFYKWFKGDNEVYPVEIRWLKARISKDEEPEEKPTLSIEEVAQLSNSFKKIELKILTLLLFDSGFRIAEMLSVKKKDLTFDIFDEETQEKTFWINCNESKTVTRRVPVPLFIEELQSFCNSIYFKSLKNEELLFPISYDYYRQALTRNALELFKKDRVTPHALRHSSATYYSREYNGNMNMISQRYGWSFSSKELKVYIRKSGAYQKAGAKQVYSNELGKIKKENEQLRTEFEVMKNQYKNLVTKLQGITPELNKQIRA